MFARRNYSKFAEELREYFFCEAAGIPRSTCERSFERLAVNVALAIGYALLGLYPIVSLIYVVNVEELRAGCCGNKKSSGTGCASIRSSIALKGAAVSGNSAISKANSKLSLAHNV